MPALTINRPALLGLLGVACGPLAPQDDTGDGTSAGPGTDPTDPTATDPTVASDPTSPTTTQPPPECNSDADCDLYCGYCTLDGRCEEGVGCCGEVSPPPRGNKFRCSPYYECYDDIDCGYGHQCTDHVCEPQQIVLLPPCPPSGEVFKNWNLGATPSAFVLADLDGDKDLDIAAAQPGAAQIELALNDGAGDFVLAGAFPVGAPATHLSIAAGDLDGDGDTDLAIGRQGVDGGLILAFGQDAKFIPGPLLPGVGDSVTAVHITDVNADGGPDILAIHEVSGAAGVRLGDGLGNFGDEFITATKALQQNTSIADVNGDGLADLLTAAGLEAMVWSNNFAGDFDLLAVRGFNVFDPTLIAAALDPLDAPELVLTGGTNVLGIASVWQATGPADWVASPQRYSTVFPLRGALAADVLPPGGLDLVAATASTSVSVLAGDNAGGFICERLLDPGFPTAPGLFAAGDVDGDSVTEIVVADPGSPAVAVLNF